MLLTRRLLLAGAGATLLPPHAFGSDAGPAQSLVLEARELAPGLGYGEAGDVLRARRGADLHVRLMNRLERPTSIHWRGLRGPNSMDGVAPLVQKPTAPGESFDYRFAPPDAGTFIFHAHAEPEMAAQTARGLTGVLIVEEDAPLAVDREIVAAIGDAPPAADRCANRAIVHTGAEIAGMARAAPLRVNGAAGPELHTLAPRARVRLRLANLSAGRLAPVEIRGAQAPVVAQVIAVDGQPCPPFEPLRGIVPAAPGSRFDIVFDMPAEEGDSVALDLLGGPSPAPLMVLRAQGRAVEARPPLEPLPENPLLPGDIALQKARRLDMVLEVSAPADPERCPDAPPSVWRINGKPGGSRTPLLSVKRGTPVALGFINRTQAPVVMRVHGHAVRQLHLADDGWDPYWRDTIVVAPGRTARVAFVADNPGLWRIGAGVLAHALGGLSGVIEVS